KTIYVQLDSATLRIARTANRALRNVFSQIQVIRFQTDSEIETLRRVSQRRDRGKASAHGAAARNAAERSAVGWSRHSRIDVPRTAELPLLSRSNSSDRLSRCRSSA